MARNEEKANTMLARFWAEKMNRSKKQPRRRPALADRCDRLDLAEKFRRQIIKEISKDVSFIQNAALGEHKIRDLNDNINKLFREKRHWERRIRELGGPDHSKSKISLSDQAIVSTGYMYFGAAKDLPGVRELLETRAESKTNRKTRWELFQLIDYDYFGFGDDEDGILADKERMAEERAIAHKVNLWKKEREEKGLGTYIMPLCTERRGELKAAHVALPSEEDIRKRLLDKRKQMLLQRFTEDTPESRLLALQTRLAENTTKTKTNEKKKETKV